MVDLHSTVNVSANYLFIQSIPFLHTISRRHEFMTIEHVNGKKIS